MFTHILTALGDALGAKRTKREGECVFMHVTVEINKSKDKLKWTWTDINLSINIYRYRYIDKCLGIIQAHRCDEIVVL